MKEREVVLSIKWYLELKNFSLSKVLAFKTPLSVEDQQAIRMYYSQYFVGLMSAIDYCSAEKSDSHKQFLSDLKDTLAFDADKKNNYCYLRELRNSVVHRGMDIMGAAHVVNDIPLFVAPEQVFNYNGEKSYKRFGYYLIEIVDRVESVIGPVFLGILEREKCLDPFFVDKEAARLESMNYILQSDVMPDWAKQIAVRTLDEVDYDKMVIDDREALRRLLYYKYPMLIEMMRILENARKNKGQG